MGQVFVVRKGGVSSTAKDLSLFNCCKNLVKTDFAEKYNLEDKIKL